MPKLILDLKDKRPAWAMPPWVEEEIRAALPAEWSLHVMETAGDGSGDGVANLDPRLLEAAEDAEIYMGYGVPAPLLQAGRSLKWVHSGATGVGASLTSEMLASPVAFTNSKGIHGPPMADTVLGMILYFARGLDFSVSNKAQARWNQDPFYRRDHPLVELEHSVVGVFGFGGIGREVANRVLALGARVLAFDLSHGAEGFGEAEPLGGSEGFDRLLAESDFLVITAPETPESRGTFGREALTALKAGAVLINVSRGALVESDALLDALAEGRLRGVGLDVFETEPIQEDHPLWGFPNVIITPHVSGVSRHFWRRQTDLIVENLRRYFADEELLNLVDKQAGF